MSISVQEVTKTYNEQKALNRVSFEVAKGEIVGFLGPNGAGKSTMMKIITSFIPPTEGTVSVCGLDVMKNSMEVRKQVGYLPEHNPLYLDMYVREYLHFIAGIHHLSDKKSKIDEMIDKVGLEVEQRKKIGALSKGYRQRVGLAQSLIHDPAVLILDEPTTGLDPNQIGEIRNLIKSLGKEKTVMLSTHIMQEVEAICDRVIIINRGEIVADEAVGDIRGMTGSSAVFYIEFDREADEKSLEKIAGVESVTSLGDRKWKIKSQGEVDVRNGLTQFAMQHGLTIQALSREEKSLESIFRQLTVGE